MIAPPEQTAAMMQGSGVRSTPPRPQPLNPATSLPPTVSAVGGDESKRTAAAMADKLASLSAPAFHSLISSLAAEQAASINGGSPSGEFSGGPPGFQNEKRPRIEKATQASDMGAPFFGQAPQVQQQVGAVPTSLGGMQPPMPGPFPPPPPPPLPSILPPLLQQFAQNTGGMIGVGGSFGMMAGSIPPPSPLSLPAGFPGLSGPPPPPPPPPPPAQNQTQQQQSPQPPQQSPTSTGFFQTSSMGFFPPVQVQQSPSAQRQ